MIGSCIVVGMHDFDGSIIKSHKIIKTLVISSMKIYNYFDSKSAYQIGV